MKYLIAIDLDDTLLTTNKKVTDYSKKVIDEIKGRGHKIVLATGRSYDGAINHYNKLNLDTPLITLHGGYTWFLDNDINKFIDTNFIKRLNNELEDIILSAIYNGSKEIYSYNFSKELEFSFNGANNNNIKTFDINNISNQIINIAVAIKAESTDKFEAFFTNEDIIPRSWGIHNDIAFYDLHIKDVSKANALKNVLNYYNLTTDHLITFGDGPNDIEMLSMAKYSVAMINARDYVKKHADDVTEFDYNNDGVAKHLNKLLENGTL